MERFNALSRGSKVMLVAGALLLIDTFFAWQQVEVEEFGIEASQNAWHGFWGVMLGLLTALLVAWFVAKLAGVEINLPISDAMLGGLLALVILLFTLIKILDDEFTNFWAYVGLVLAAIIAIGAWLNIQDAGGVDTLKSEVEYDHVRFEVTAVAGHGVEECRVTPLHRDDGDTGDAAPTGAA